MQKKSRLPQASQGALYKIGKITALLFWAVFIIICVINRKYITVERIINYTPKNLFVAALVMLFCFALKGISVFIYGGILYAASGILFPLPVAIAVNAAGTVIMISVPYFIGKRLGKGAVTEIAEKHPKLQLLREFQSKNELFFSFLTRAVGMLPSDIVSMYMGAANIKYSSYIIGSLLGLLPAIIAFSVMGMSADDPSSPQFIASALFEIGFMLVSVVYFLVWKRKRKIT